MFHKSIIQRTLEDWEIEVMRAHNDNLAYYRTVLTEIAAGHRYVVEDIGDTTEEERRKAEWFVKHYESAIARMELGVANDNDPSIDADLEELISADW